MVVVARTGHEANVKGASALVWAVRRAASGLLLVLVLGACLTKPSPVAPTTSAPWFGFAAPVTPTPAPDGYGSEPSILSAHDGELYVVSVLGSASARGDGLWSSGDRGLTWTYHGKPDYPFGGGDADLDEDSTGRLYLPGQWRGAVPPTLPTGDPGCYVTTGESMATSTDGGATWFVYPVASDTPVVDRQWTATAEAGHAYLVFNQADAGLTVTQSLDGGRTWTSLRTVPGTYDVGGGAPCGDPVPSNPLGDPAVSGGPNGIPGDVLVDPRDHALYIPYAPSIGGAGRHHRLFVSHDQAASFESHVIRTTPQGEQPSAIFGTLAMDDAGGLYYAWAESVNQRHGVQVLVAFSKDHGATWSQPVGVSPPGMVAVFPWVVAGAPGHVAVGFYATTGAFTSDDAPAGTLWYPVVALSRNLDATNGTFELRTLSGTPNHKGPICTSGTGCSGGRTLGDFFEVGLGADGRLAVVWADDLSGTRTNAVAVQGTGSLR